MPRILGFAFVIVLALGCSNQAKQAAHDKALVDNVTKETKELLEKQTAELKKAAEDRLAGEADAAVAAKTAEDTAEAIKVSQLKQDITDHPGKYLEFTGMKYFDRGVVQGDRRLTRVSVTNLSSYSLRVRDAHLTGLDAEGVPITTAPIGLNGAVPPGRTRTFDGLDVKSGSLQGNAQSTHIDVTGVEIIDVGENGDQ